MFLLVVAAVAVAVAVAVVVAVAAVAVAAVAAVTFAQKGTLLLVEIKRDYFVSKIAIW